MKIKPYAEGFESTDFEDYLIDSVMPNVSSSEWVVLCFIKRKMGRLDKDCRDMALDVIQSGTGLSRPTVVSALDYLAKKGHIVRSARAGHVYLLRVTGHDLYKVGVTTKTPEERTSQFSVKMPFETSIVGSIKSDDAYGLEKSLHGFYTANGYKRANGEWFNLDGRAIEYFFYIKENEEK